MRLRAVLIVVLLYLTAGCSFSEPKTKCEFPLTISAGKIGPVSLNSSIAELGSFYSIVESSLPYTDESGYKVEFCANEAIVLIKADQMGAVVSMSTTSNVFETEQGGRVGMTINRLQEVHPDGTLVTGAEEGGWIAFHPKNLSGYFEFKLEGAERSCLLDNTSCPPDFFEKSAIRYWVNE